MTSYYGLVARSASLLSFVNKVENIDRYSVDKSGHGQVLSLKMPFS